MSIVYQSFGFSLYAAWHWRTNWPTPRDQVTNPSTGLDWSTPSPVTSQTQNETQTQSESERARLTEWVRFRLTVTRTVLTVTVILTHSVTVSDVSHWLSRETEGKWLTVTSESLSEWHWLSDWESKIPKHYQPLTHRQINYLLLLMIAPE